MLAKIALLSLAFEASWMVPVALTCPPFLVQS